jgi:3-deoxy-D-manno-octulosonic-acid transferase
MFVLYQLLTIVIVIFSPLLILIRFYKKKDHKKRFLEKFTIYQNKTNFKKKNNIWFHAVSIGELISIIPLIIQLEKNEKIDNILVTTSTLSSAYLFENFQFKKTFHKFFPLDFYLFTSRFLKLWKPKVAIFIDSEIWPNTFRELKKKKIALLLINARLTKKSFSRWRLVSNYAKKIFNSINIAYPQNKETSKYLKNLGLKNIKNFGNLKFIKHNFEKNNKLSKSTIEQFKDRLIWIASSTHPNEELIIGSAHKVLKKKYKNLLTIIIPRHIERSEEILQKLKKEKLNIIVRSTGKKIKFDTDIFLVDKFGETKMFFKISKFAFIGGSLNNHGGQNPIEPAQHNLKVVHGPNIENFREIYHLFKKKKISYRVNNLKQLIKIADHILSNKKNNISLKRTGELILKKYVKEINQIFNNEIKKTKILGLQES